MLTTAQLDRSGKPFKISRKTPATLVGIGQKNRLLYIQEYQGTEEEELAIDKKMLKVYDKQKSLTKLHSAATERCSRFPRMQLHTRFVDPNFYVFAPWTWDLLAKSHNKLKSLVGDIIPFLLQIQYKPKLAEGNANYPVKRLKSDVTLFLGVDVRGLGFATLQSDFLHANEIKCLIYEMDESNKVARVVSPSSYLEINREARSC